MNQKAFKKKLEAKRVKNLEAALKEERLGLMALTLAFCRSHGDTDLLMSKVNAMAAAVADDPRASAGLRAAMIHGRAYIENAVAIESGRPQRLFEPDVGHVKPDDAARLVNAGPEQMSLGGPQASMEQRDDFVQRVDAGLVAALEVGALTEEELFARYALNTANPRASKAQLRRRRRQLANVGRLVKTTDEGADKWTTIERMAA